MKMRLLPGTDLARAAVQDGDMRRRTLEGLKTGHAPYSYNPVREAILDLLHITAGPLAPHKPTPWEIIKNTILRSKQPENGRLANLQVAKALRGFADAEHTLGRKQEFFPLTVGTTTKLEFWSPAVVSVSGQAMVLFIDPRRAKRLTAESRRFVLSVMHQRVREANPDYHEVELGIMQFDSDGDERRARLYVAASQPLYGYDELNQMVQETYAVWKEVLEERTASAPRKTGTGGFTFDF